VPPGRPSVSVRPLEPDDAPACDAIVASLPYHFGDEHGRKLCAAAVREQAGLVATAGAGPIAFVTWRLWYAASAEITWMAVHAGERRRGVGRLLVDELVKALPAATRYLVVTTLSEATPEPGVEDGYAGTRRFWRRSGFEPVWEPAGWWSNENQAVLMVRPLNGWPLNG
jgi:ribosomal protein S18 acetylase RimI-like enzyme